MLAEASQHSTNESTPSLRAHDVNSTDNIKAQCSQIFHDSLQLNKTSAKRGPLLLWVLKKVGQQSYLMSRQVEYVVARHKANAGFLPAEDLAVMDWLLAEVLAKQALAGEGHKMQSP